jgi:hypothetical protein
MDAQAIVQRTCSVTFTHFADDFVRAMRERMFVPEHADDDVEAELSAFRVSLDAHYPEFWELFASTLSDQLGPARLEGMLSALSTESAQHYLEAAPRIERELEQSLPRLTRELTTTAQAALSGSAAPGNEQSMALTLARATGAYELLKSRAQAVTLQVLPGHHDAAAAATSMESPEAQRVQGALLGKLLGFYARTFIRHVGRQRAAAVVEELQREPLQRYVRARSGIKPVLDRHLRALIMHILKEVFGHAN